MLYFFCLCTLTSSLNTLYLSMDANFKLKQKDRGFNDPPLSNRLVYMVADEKLQDHLAHCLATGQVTEVRLFLTCTETPNPSIRSTPVVLCSTPSLRLIRSTPRGMLLPALVGLIVRDMGSSDRMVLSTYSEVNGELTFSHLVM